MDTIAYHRLEPLDELGDPRLDEGDDPLVYDNHQRGLRRLRGSAVSTSVAPCQPCA